MQQHQLEAGQMAIVSQLYLPAGLYTQVAPQRGEAKPRRRRRKLKKDTVVAKKRKLSEEQVNMLEMSFGCEHKLESQRKDQIASELGLDPKQVAVWFQNRRARWKNKKLEEEFSKLRAEHESVVIQKRSLEAEVLRLKEQLSNAHSEIQKLIERSDTVSNNSPTSSSTIGAMDPQLFEEFAFENMFCGAENVYASYNMEWVNLCNL